MKKHWLFAEGVIPEATQLSKSWAIRPAGQLGTMGFSPVPWEVVYVAAPSAKSAIQKAKEICRLFN